MEATLLDRALFVGDHTHREFQEGFDWLANRCQVTRVPNVEAARLQACGGPLGLIIVAQARPGLFSQTDIESLHRIAPLARLVALLGGWCDGETCSGRPWSGVVRMYWHEFTARLASELDGGQRTPALWNLPRTATDAERLELRCRPPANRQAGLIAISAQNAIVYDGLAAACVQAGYSTAWISPRRAMCPQGAEIGIWDDSSLASADPLDIAAFVDRVHPAPVVALMSFPRFEQSRRIQAAGAVVHAKPFSLDDLTVDLKRLTQTRPAPQRTVSAA